MSSTDKRIVQMQFDNAQFEAGVSKSMSTLDKLEQKLQFKNSASGLKTLQTSIDAVTFTKMADGIEALEKRFSTFGIVGMNIVNQLTNGAINAAKSLEQATIGQIKSGGWSRAMNLANAKFQIEGLGFDWDTVLKAVDYGVTDTAYGLDAAAKAASQLAASGVDFEEVLEEVNGIGLTQMHKALRAISGVAAMTNSSYEDIARVFTTVAGNGRLMGDQLLQMSSRGLNAAATLAQAFGMTEQEVRDMVSKGMISFDMFAEAMDQAYGEHAKEANATFTGALSNMKAALSRIGAIFAQPVVDKTNVFFNALTGKIKEVQKALNDLTDENGNKVIRFAGHFAEAWEAGVNVFSELVSAIDLSWFDTVAEKADNAAKKVRDFFNYIDEKIQAVKNIGSDLAEATEEAVTELDENLITQQEYNAAMAIMFGNANVNGSARVKWIEQQGLSYKKVQGYIDSVVAAGWDVKKASVKVADGVTSDQSKMTKAVSESEKEVKLATSAEEAYAKQMDQVARSHEVAKYRITEYSKSAEEAYAKQMDQVYRSHKTPAQQAFESIENIVLNIKNIVSNITGVVVGFTASVKKAFRNVFSINDFLTDVEGLTGRFSRLSDIFGWTEKKASAVEIIFTSLFKKLKRLYTVVKDVTNWFFDLGLALLEGVSGAEILESTVISTSDVLGSIQIIFVKFATGIRDFISDFGKFIDLVKQTSGFKRLADDITRIKDAIVGAVDGAISPAKSELKGFADSFQMPTIEDVADAVGFIFGKIADFIEAVPGWIASIKSFASEVWTFIEPWVDKISSLTFDFDGLSTTVSDLASSAGEDLGGFLSTMWTSVSNKLSEIDWDDIWAFLAKVAKTFVMLRALWNVASGADAISKFFKGLSSLPTAIDKFLYGVDKSFNRISKGFSMASIGYLLKQIGESVLLITASIIALSEIPKEKYAQAVDTIMGIGVLLFIILMAISKFNNKAKTVQVGIGNVAGPLAQVGVMMAGTGILLLAISKLVSSFADSSAKIETTLDKDKPEETLDRMTGIMDVIKNIVYTILIGIAIFSLIMAKVGVKDGTGMNMLLGLVGIAAVMAVMGWVIEKVANAIGYLSNIETIPPAAIEAIKYVVIAMCAAFLALIVGFIYMTANTKVEQKKAERSVWQLIGNAAIIIAIAYVIKEVMAGFMEIMAAIGGGNLLEVATAFFIAIGLLMVVILFVQEINKLLAKNSKKVKPWEMALVIASVGLTVMLMGMGIAEVFKALASVPTDENTSSGDVLLQAMLALVIVMGAVTVAIYAITKMFDELPNVKSKDLLYVGGVFLMFSAALLIMSIGITMIMSTLAGASTNGWALMGQTLILLGGVLLVSLLAISVILKQLDSYKNITSEDLIYIGLIFIEIGAALLIIAIAFAIIGKTIASMSPKQATAALLALFGMLALMLVSVVAVAYLITQSGEAADAISNVGLIFIEIAASILIIAAAFYMLSQVDSIGTGIVLLVAMAAIVVVLAVLAAKVPGVSKAFTSLGVGMLLVGAGFALAASSFILIGVGLKLITQELKNLTPVLSEFFDLVEEHKALFVLLMVIVTVLTVAIIYAAIQIVPAIAKVASAIGSILSGIVSLLKSFGSFISQGVSKLSKNVSIGTIALIGGLLTALVNIAPEAVDKVMSVIVTILDKIASSIGMIVEALLNLIINVIYELAGSIIRNRHRIVAAIGALLSALWSVLLTGFGTLGKWINDLVEKATGKRWDFLTEFEETCEAEAEAIAEENQVIIDAANEADGYSLALEGLGGSTLTAKGKVDDLTESIDYAKFEMNQYNLTASQMRDINKEAAESAAELAKVNKSLATGAGYTEYVKNKRHELMQATTLASDVISDLAGNTSLSNLLSGQGLSFDADNIGNLASQLGFDPSSSIDMGQFANLDFSDASITGDLDFSSLMDGNEDAAFGAGESMSDSYLSGYSGSIESGYSDATDEALQGAIDKSNEYKGDFEKAGKTIGDAQVTGFKNEVNDQRVGLPARARDAGVNVNKGIQDGLGSNMAQTVGMFRQLALNCIDQFNMTFQIASPSKVMRKSGKFIDEGLILGLQDKAADVENATAGIGDAMIVTFGKSFEDLAAVARGDIPYDMSIRPVMDTSSVATGAASIDSMFRNQNVSISGVSGEIAANIGELDSRNQDVVEELMQLRSDMGDMTDAMTNMQMVLDTGALVGNLAGPLDKDLGRRAIFKRRGS